MIIDGKVKLASEEIKRGSLIVIKIKLSKKKAGRNKR